MITFCLFATQLDETDPNYPVLWGHPVGNECPGECAFRPIERVFARSIICWPSHAEQMLAAAPCQRLTSSLFFFFFSPTIITDPFTPVFGPFAYKAAPLQVFLSVPRFRFMVCLSKCCFPSVQAVWNGLSWCCIVESPLLCLLIYHRIDLV